MTRLDPKVTCPQQTAAPESSLLRRPFKWPAVKTPQHYRKLTREQADVFQRELEVRDAPIGEAALVMECLIHLAEIFARRYPADRYSLFGFGRSPLLFLEVLKAMDGGINDYTAVGGTGFRDLHDLLASNNWQGDLDKFMADDKRVFQAWYRQELDTKGIRYSYHRLFHPAQGLRKNLTGYKKYLTAKGLDPDTVLRRAGDGKRTVILDGIATGYSIRLFAELLYIWACQTGREKAYTDAVSLHLFAAWQHDDAQDSLNRLQTMGYKAEIDNAVLNPDVLAFREIMNQDSFGLGTPLRYSHAKSWFKNLSREQRADTSSQANLVRFTVMQALDQVDKLKKNTQVLFGSWFGRR